MNSVKKTGALLALLGLAGSAFAADYSTWGNKRDIILNTAGNGAGTTTDVYNFPVLIRLGANEAAILGAAGANGESIRFSKADNTTALPYEIEHWSPTAAAIWVKVDTIKANNSTQKIVMHWNKSGVASESNGAAVFDTANGFRGVWHLHDSTGAKSTDATVFNTNATWYNAPTLTDGIIGKAVNLTQPMDLEPGNARHLRAPYNAANQNFKATSANGITLSVWVKRTANSDGLEQGILGRYNWGTNARQAMIALNSSDQIRLFRSTNGTNSGGAETNFGNATITDGVWTHIVATLKNGSQVLYVNGVQDVAQTTAAIGSLDSVWANSSVLSFGRMAPDHEGNPVHQSFSGVIDEARYTATARSADWVKLEYENQKIVNTLVNVGLPTAPGAPTGVTGTPGNTQVTVSWTAPASDGGSPVTGYKAMVSNDTAKSCTTTGALTCTVTGLTNGTAYTFVVKAINAVGASAASTASAGVTPTTTVPAAPTNVVAVAGAKNSASVTVSWAAPANTGGSAITGYKAMAVSDTLKSCTSTGALTCTVTGLTPGAVYTFVVKASNSVGTSVASTPSAAVNAPVPVSPGSLALNVGQFTRPYTFVLPEAAAAVTERLTLSITDAWGRTVWRQSVSPKSGAREITWPGLNAKGRKVSSGVYFASVEVAGAGNAEEAVKLEVKLRQD